jgi:LysM repeat protein
VLALNGLSRTSLIFPGQVLKLTGTVSSTTPAPSAPVHAAAALQTVPAYFTAPLTASGSYTIKRGDTVTSIARQFGTTVKQILAANNLSPSSMIYAGRTLVIPGGTVTPQASPPQIQISQVGAVTVPLSPTMQTNAQTIIAVGKRLGVPSYGIIIALAAAAQESGLQNLNYGDQDSVGLFQQRPSAGWGNDAQLENPTYASELFYGGPSNPNIGRTRGLLDIPGWQSMSVTQAAQAVQSSAYPLAYAKWEASARSWYALLG